MRKNQKLIASIIAFVLVGVMIFSILLSVLGGTAGAVTQSQIDALQAQRDALADKNAELQGQIDELEVEIQSYLELKEKLDNQILLIREDIDLLTEQIAIYDEMIANKAIELEAAEEDVATQYVRYRTRVRAMEEHGKFYYISVLFQATSFSSLLTRLADISEIMEYDSNLEKQYKEARDYCAQVKAEYEQIQAEQEAKKLELEVRMEDLEEQTIAAANVIAELEFDLDEFRRAYDENEAAEHEMMNEIDDLIAKLEAEKASANIVSTGSYIWPTPSCYSVSSQFGYRYHPIYGDYRMHYGIDISASSGASILAADSGTVTTATYSSSYGNYVMINHGDGRYTVYAHMSSMAVSVGNTVTQGETIGYVGSTGWSTGPHLHFEVISSGGRVDPLQYFSGYTLT